MTTNTTKRPLPKDLMRQINRASHEQARREGLRWREQLLARVLTAAGAGATPEQLAAMVTGADEQRCRTGTPAGSHALPT